MNYRFITALEQSAVIEGQIRSLEQQHFQATVNLEAAKTANTHQDVSGLEANVAGFEAQLTHLYKVADKLSAPADKKAV